MGRPLTAAGRACLADLAEHGSRRTGWIDSRPLARLEDDGYVQQTYEVVRIRPNGQEVKEFVVRITDAGRAALDSTPGSRP